MVEKEIRRDSYVGNMGVIPFLLNPNSLSGL